MKEFLKNPWVVAIIVFFILRISIGYIFDLAPHCYSGWHSPSIGHSGACSHNGGVDDRAGASASFFSFLFALILGVYLKDRNSINLGKSNKKHKSVRFLNEDNSNAPVCPLHGKMVLILNEEDKKCYACKQYPKCQYWSNYEVK